MSDNSSGNSGVNLERVSDCSNGNKFHLSDLLADIVKSSLFKEDSVVNLGLINTLCPFLLLIVVEYLLSSLLGV